MSYNIYLDGTLTVRPDCELEALHQRCYDFRLGNMTIGWDYIKPANPYELSFSTTVSWNEGVALIEAWLKDIEPLVEFGEIFCKDDFGECWKYAYDEDEGWIYYRSEITYIEAGRI